MTSSNPPESTTPKPPHFVVYSDLWVGTQPPDPSSLKVALFCSLRYFTVTSAISRDSMSCAAFSIDIVQLLNYPFCSNLSFLLLAGAWDNVGNAFDLFRIGI